MSKDKISDYSATANSNTDIGGINIDEGCAPSGINDAIRTLMKQLKDWQSGSQDVYIHPAGSASVPSITATGDTNTGLFFPAADTIALTTGGTERARVDSSGNVGIGTTSPASKVHAYDTTYRQIRAQGTGGYVTVGHGSGSGVIDTSTYLVFSTSDTERARLDSSGNLGLGVTPSAWSGAKAIDVGQVGTGVSGSAGNANITQGAYNDGSWKRSQASYGVNLFNVSNGAYYWFQAASGSTGSAISWTQAMTLDASGNLGIGLTSPTPKSGGGAGVLDANGPVLSRGAIAVDQTSAAVFQYNSNEASIRAYGATSNSGFITFRTGGGGSSDTERARIDSSGNLLVGTTSSTNLEGAANRTLISTAGSNGLGVIQASTGGWCIATNAANNGGTFYHVSFDAAGTQVGKITSSTTTTTYATSSDYRLKENVAPMVNALATIAALKPCTYTWKADGSDGHGFIAHELQAVVPDAVVGEKDAVNEDGSIKPQGIDTSFLVATLTAAIQELNAKFEAYKAAHP